MLFCQRVRRVCPFLLWGILGMAFLGFLASLLCLVCSGEVLVLLVSFLRSRLGLLWCASCSARLFGVVRREHYLCNHWRERQAAHKIACFHFWFYNYFVNGKPYMLALAGRPSLHGHDACMIYWAKGTLRRNRRQKYCKTPFSPFRVFLLSRNSMVRFWELGYSASLDWAGAAPWATPS